MVINIKFFKINYFNISFCLIILSSILFYSIISLTFGQYPYLKKLINGKYIVISTKGITFFDENLNESNNIEFEIEGYYYYYSTCIEEFPKEEDEYDEYIIVFFRTDFYNIYIFSSNETLIGKTENISITDIFNQYLSIIPYAHSGNEYYFSLIYYCSTNFNLKIMKGVFNSFSNTTSFQSLFELESIIRHSYFSFSCILMNYYDNQKVINCIYENDDTFACTNIYPYKNFSINECPINSLNINNNKYIL